MKHSLKVALAILIYSIPCLLSSNVIAQQEPTNLLQYKQVELWNIYEIKLDGPQAGNPFVDVILSAEFKKGGKVYAPQGFYDGNGIYSIGDTKDKVPVLVGAIPNTDPKWGGDLSDDYPDLTPKLGLLPSLSINILPCLDDDSDGLGDDSGEY